MLSALLVHSDSGSRCKSLGGAGMTTASAEKALSVTTVLPLSLTVLVRRMTVIGARNRGSKASETSSGAPPCITASSGSHMKCYSTSAQYQLAVLCQRMLLTAVRL